MNPTNFFDTFPVLETKRLKLIQITHQHAADIFAIFANNNVTEHYDCFSFTTLSEAESIISHHEKKFQTKTGIRWGITLKGCDNIIGTIGFNHFEIGRTGVIGYELNEKFWSQGIITEAIKCITEFGFSIMSLRRIEASVAPENIASQKVLATNGFTKEGIMRDKGFWKNQFQTFVVYSKLSTDL